MGCHRVAFIGFGEVASIFSSAARERGAKVAAYDVLLEREGGAGILNGRTRAEGIRFLPLQDAISEADCIFSTVTTHVAADAARACAAYLRAGQIYLDLNATAPPVKCEIGRIVSGTGADFVEGAVLGAVGVTGADTRILTGGEKGAEVAQVLNGLGLNAAFYSPEIGKASTFKMLRSVFSKGLEALILEFLIAGKRAGIQGDLWAEVVELLTQNPFDRVAANWVQTHAVACERRWHEMTQVTDVMRRLGIEPVITEATEVFFERSCKLGLKDAFVKKPDDMDAVIDFMEKRL